MSFKHDYVSAMLDAKTMVDDVVEDVPAAVEHYRHLATDAFNTGLILFKSAQFNDAAILARLSCEAASIWHSKKGEAEGMIEVRIVIHGH